MSIMLSISYFTMLCLLLLFWECACQFTPCLVHVLVLILRLLLTYTSHYILVISRKCFVDL
jgi:hypothetical protein